MSDRDTFAAAALTGLIKWKRGDDSASTTSDLARWAYHLADAMLRERARDCDGDTHKPVAWGLPDADAKCLWGVSLNKEAIQRECPTNQSLLPLYRQPQPTLTDDEREAIEACVKLIAKTKQYDSMPKGPFMYWKYRKEALEELLGRAQ